MRKQKGFTLIELMVVIVIIGILSALAIPKMFGVSAKAKAAEAPQVIANWETLNSAYAQETGGGGLPGAIGFQIPTSSWWDYDEVAPTTTLLTATATADFGACADGENFTSTFDVATDSYAHASSDAAGCGAYVPNFLP